MPWGVQTWNADGSSQIEMTSSLGRVFGKIAVQEGQSGSLSDARFAQGQPFYFTIPLSPDANIARPPEVTFAGSVMSWTWTSDSVFKSAPTLIIYGVR